MEPVYAPVIALARTLFALEGLKFTLSGTEHVPRRGGAVMVINHTGYMDFTYAGWAAKPAGRYVRFMAKESVFRHRVSGPLMRGMKHIPVDRAQGAQSYRTAVDNLGAGEIVGVFPEATISQSFELKEFKNGAARMAREAGVPILPTVIWGSQRVWTKGHPKRLGRTGVPITVDIGAPVRVGPDDDVDVVTAAVRETMTGMLHRAQEAYEPLTGADRIFLPARLGGSAPTLEEATAAEVAERRRRA
ncbi:MAG: 1-acyl-sn-glycerol-3-phosphate acyltransferase [Actinomycetota bacterium]|nr:1-acyl-sn-glycerol-3-phosphate acyltransferase [Actinomycetota bacterium]